MRFRQFNAVLSEDFEWLLLLGAINHHINEIQKNGGDAGDIVRAKEKLIFYSNVVDKPVKTAFEGNVEKQSD